MAGKMTRVRVTPATLREIEKQVDWDRVRAMSDEEIARDVEADPDAVPPLEGAQIAAMRVQGIRKATRLSQAEFAAKFHIPLATLRDWEQGRRRPNAVALAYLTVISHNQAAVMQALDAA